MGNMKLVTETVRYKSYEEFYNSIEEKGSLGLLAFGARGVLAWKKKKNEIEAKRKKSVNENK